MDPIQLQKLRAINKSKKHQLLDSFFLYFMTLLTCSLFCSSPFWFPLLFTSTKSFLSVSLPKIGSIILSAKCIFVVGNLIVILLIGESKFLSSNSLPKASDEYYNEYVDCKKVLQNPSNNAQDKNVQFKENPSKTCGASYAETKFWNEGKLEVVDNESEGFEGEEEISLPTEELNKRADDFIARVNKQRMQEAKLLLY